MGIRKRLIMDAAAIGVAILLAVGFARPVKGADDAQTLYMTRCASCHGVSGHGDGPRARSLEHKPHDFNDCDWMSMMSNPTLFLAIENGGLSIGPASGMPAYAGKLSEKQMAALVNYIRRFCAAKAR
ncbi:MAG: c-type cytochrome [Candidatus Binataceae bacterium]